jgi:hypothetical protein
MDVRQPIQIDAPPMVLLPAAVGVFAAALVLLSLPAAVAILSILDGRVLDRAHEWLSSSLALTPYLDFGRLVLSLALALVVRTAKEDQ